MKLLTVCVPCYNSAGYIDKCMDSLLPGGEDIEILIVNDGSTDQTGAMAEEYARLHPTIVRVIHQPNGGHGAAVNTGMKHAAGRYFKVVDSDDWLDSDCLNTVLSALRGFDRQNLPDAVLCNYVYEKEGKRHKKVVRYANALPMNRMFSWREIGHFNKGQYLLMHAIIYRTAMLRACGLKLPKHTFYVDNLYAYLPMAAVRTLYYLDMNLYHYYIGRQGQSVQEDIMIKRIDQQLLVNRKMIDSLDLDGVENAKQRKYLRSYLEIVTIVSTVLLRKSGSKENLQKRAALYAYLRDHNNALYLRVRYGLMGTVANLPGAIGRAVLLFAYRVSRRVVGFN